jgi:hypothetical protein
VASSETKPGGRTLQDRSAKIGEASDCDDELSPPGYLTDFEIDLRSNPDRILGVVVDPENDFEIIGYRVRTGSDSWLLRIVDREGNYAGGDERGLETPPVDPLDFIPSPATVAKSATVVGKVGLKALGKFVVKGGARRAGWQVTAGVLPNLRRVSKTLLDRSVAAAIRRARELPRTLGRIRLSVTERSLEHTFFEKGSQWFGRSMREADREAWRAVVQRAHTSPGRLFPWTAGAERTIARLIDMEGKKVLLQYNEVTGALSTIFVPGAEQLRQIRSLLRLMKRLGLE